MSIIENFKSAIFNILSSKMRTFLTTLGIIIGITSVIIITAIGKGFQNDINENLSDIDKSSVGLYTSYDKQIRNKDKFTLKDIEDLKKLDNIEYVVPEYGSNVSVKLKDPSKLQSAVLSGANEDAKEKSNIKMKYGRFIALRDREANAKVCVIDNKLALKIFGREDALGETISAETVFGNIKNIELEVIGVYKTENEFYTPQIFYPIETALTFLDNKEKTFENISLTIKDTKEYYTTKKAILKLLVANHNNTEDKYDVFESFSMSNSIDGTIQIFTVFIGLVASISLLVGGVGVMNIMLVTVTERTREIGIRKSLGATNGNIKMQFLIEAITVALLGGVMGIIFGYIGSFLAGKVITLFGATLKPQVSIPVVIGAVVISSMIGVIFGVYPASKAAKLDPIEALRYE